MDKNRKPRKHLTLEERVTLIRLFKLLPNYPRLADIFDVSEIAIKYTITRSEKFMQYYNKRTNYTQPYVPISKVNKNVVKLLEECVYEVLRTKEVVTEPTLRMTTAAFLKHMQLNHRVYPAWKLDFCKRYGINLSEPAENECYQAPSAYKLQKILEYCDYKLAQQRMAENEEEIAEDPSIFQVQLQPILNSLPVRNEEAAKFNASNANNLEIRNLSDVAKSLRTVRLLARATSNHRASTLVSKLKRHIRKIYKNEIEKDQILPIIKKI